ncbi:MAG: hypothetical protein VKI63_06145 [Cyanobium sp.]|nr:hypothetical protein [Cyanobium sp.]
MVEDALIDQARQTLESRQSAQQLQEQLADAQQVILAAAEDNAAYHTILTNPELLARYTNEFFGPEGVYPVELPRDRLAAEVAYGESGQQMPAPRAMTGAPQFPLQAAPQPQFQAEAAPRPEFQAEASGAQFRRQPEAPIAYERPQLDIRPPQQQASGTPGDALATFSALFDRDPAAAAQFLATGVPPEAFRYRQFIGE